MSLFAIDFRTLVDSKGYEVVGEDDPDHPELSFWGQRFERKGGRLYSVKPLEVDSALYARFAEIGDSPPSAFLDFMNMFGPITYVHSENKNQDQFEESEKFTHVQGEQILIESLLEQWKTGEYPDWNGPVEDVEVSLFSRLVVFLEPDMTRGSRGARLRFEPPNLIDAMKLQMMQAIATDRKVRACTWCGSWFEIGGGAKRAGAIFCSDKCRTRHHNGRRLKLGRR